MASSLTVFRREQVSGRLIPVWLKIFCAKSYDWCSHRTCNGGAAKYAKCDSKIRTLTICSRPQCAFLTSAFDRTTGDFSPHEVKRFSDATFARDVCMSRSKSTGTHVTVIDRTNSRRGCSGGRVRLSRASAISLERGVCRCCKPGTGRDLQARTRLVVGVRCLQANLHRAHRGQLTDRKSATAGMDRH